MAWYNFRQKESEVLRRAALFQQVPGQFSARNYRAFAVEGYRENSIVFRCVKMIYKSVGGIPLILCRRTRDGEIEKIATHEILDLLASPNPMQGRRSFIETVIGYLLISGNSFIEIAESTSGRNKELYAIVPNLMIVKPGHGGVPSGYMLTVGDTKLFNVDPISGDSKIIHLKEFDPLDMYNGLSPLASGGRAVDTYNAQSKWNLGLLQNGGRPSGILIYEQDISKGKSGWLRPDQREQLQEKLDSISGPNNAGKILMLEGGLTYHEMGMNVKEMDYTKGRTLTAAEVANIYGIPHQLLNIQGSQTFRNYEQARVAFYVDTVLPTLDFLLDYLNRRLVSRFSDDLFLAYDEDRITALAPMRQQIWDNISNSQILTLNEKREALGYGRYEPSENSEPGDQILVNSGLIPIEEASLSGPITSPDENDISPSAEELNDSDDSDDDDE